MNKLKDRKVIIILDLPKLPIDPSKCGITRPFTITRYDPSCSFNEMDTYNKRNIHNTVIKEVAKNYPNVKIIDLSAPFCKNNRCSPIKNGDLLYMDNNHLNYKVRSPSPR